jgi:hypothetical protein
MGPGPENRRKQRWYQHFRPCSLRWFCPPAGRILDPFAGGSTRGLVAAFLGYSYTGIELRAGQISADELQAAALEAKYKIWNPSTQDEWQGPNWVEGSAENLANLTVSEEPTLLQ